MSKILVVDDEADIRRLLEYALRAEGYQVVLAADGKEALGQIERGRPDLVILDLMLPGMSGIEVCQYLRSHEETQTLPIIMLSARALVADKIKSLQAGVDEYLVKPVASEEIVARIGALLSRTRRLRQVPQVTQGKVFGFVGAKGGVGTTTVALNVAFALANQKKNTVAAELRPFYGTFSAQLRQTPGKNVSNLLELDANRITRQDLNGLLHKLGPELWTLFGPQKSDEFRDIAPDQAEAIVKGLSSIAEYVVLDLPNSPSATNQAAIRHCDRLVMLLEPEPISVAAGRVTLEQLKSWNVSRTILGVVIVNRASLATPMQPAAIRSQLDCEILGVVPPAAQGCMVAQEMGMPLVLYQPNSVFAHSMVDIARALATEQTTATRVL